MRHKKRGTLHSVPLFLRLGPCNRAGHLKISRPHQYLPSWDGPFLLPAYPPVPAAYPLPQTAASEAALPLKAFPQKSLYSGQETIALPVIQRRDLRPDQNKSFRRMEGVRGGRALFQKGPFLPRPYPWPSHSPDSTAAVRPAFFRMGGGEAETQQGLPRAVRWASGLPAPAPRSRSDGRPDGGSAPHRPRARTRCAHPPCTGAPGFRQGLDGKRPRARQRTPSLLKARQLLH